MINTNMGFAMQSFKKFVGLMDRKPKISITQSRQGNNVEYTASNNGVELGSALVVPTDTRININMLYIKPEFRRAGYASELLKQIEKDFAGRVIQVKPIPFSKENDKSSISYNDLLKFYTNVGYKGFHNNKIMLKKALIQEDMTIGGGTLGPAAAVGHANSSDWYAPGDARMPKMLGAKKKKIFKRSRIK